MADVLALGTELTEQEQLLVTEVAKLGLATHAQLASLIGPDREDIAPESAARSARRVLSRLTEWRLLSRLERRIGGVRAGSAGYVYYLGPVGQRLVAYWGGRGFTRGRIRPEPGERFVRHRLAVSELYVQARHRARMNQLNLLEFEVEPRCWRPYIDKHGHRVTLKPDAFVRVGVEAYEYQWFLEVDLGTESRSVIARKLRRYVEYFRAVEQEEARRPRVLVLTVTPAREAALIEVCAGLPSGVQRSFSVTTLDCGLRICEQGEEESA